MPCEAPQRKQTWIGTDVRTSCNIQGRGRAGAEGKGKMGPDEGIRQQKTPWVVFCKARLGSEAVALARLITARDIIQGRALTSGSAFAGAREWAK
jgi:hypothetical protein